MIWASIKLFVFMSLALVTGLLCATVPVGGETIAARAQALWAKPSVKHEVGVLKTRVRRGVAAATADSPAASAPAPDEPPTPHETRVDPHAVAKVLSDAPVGDAFKPQEREAVRHIIAQRSRELGRRGR